MSDDLLQKLRRQHPEVYLLAIDDREALQRYLRGRELIAEDETICCVDKAGEGNMNCTLRVQASRRSLIVKQSRPWVEKFPTIAATWDRVLSEARFYLLVSPEQQISDRMPDLIHLDSESRIMVLEDLGAARDFTGMYRGQPLAEADVTALAGWLAELHAVDFGARTRASLTNLDMRKLNHEHLFRLPLDCDNGLDLDEMTPGLAATAQQLIREDGYVAQVRDLGDVYLSDGRALLHGDFFPGSWLHNGTTPLVIDPEFAFFGDPEFDFGVLLAHLYLGRQPESVHLACLAAYRAVGQFDYRQALRFSGVEIMRRLIGVAQLPLALDLAGKQALLKLSQDLVTSPDVLSSAQLLAKQQLAQLLDTDEQDADVRCA